MANLKIDPSVTRIGWIGTGVMGSSMCGHLLDKGFSATVFSRTLSKSQPLLDRGASWADSPRKRSRNKVMSCFPSSGFPTMCAKSFSRRRRRTGRL